MELQFSYESWGFRKITGDPEYHGWVIIRSRNKGICSTTPLLPTGVDRKKVAKALAHLLPESSEIVESCFFLNRGYYNPK